MLQTLLVFRIDDDTSVLDALAGLLQALGFDAEVISSAEDLPRSHRPDAGT
jgi:FixJ family two-component response regulator